MFFVGQPAAAIKVSSPGCRVARTARVPMRETKTVAEYDLPRVPNERSNNNLRDGGQAPMARNNRVASYAILDACCTTTTR